jgi:hypothetical protein
MLSDVWVSATYAERHKYAECHCVECYYAECHGVVSRRGKYVKNTI